MNKILEKLRGRKTHILVLAAAIITVFQAVQSGSMDLEAAKQTIELFMVSTIREGLKAWSAA